MKMLISERIDISQGIEFDKTDKLKKCILCHYWYFKNIGHKFEPHVCNKCHDVLMTAYQLKNIAVLNVKSVDYRCILWGLTKSDIINILSNFALRDKGVL